MRLKQFVVPSTKCTVKLPSVGQGGPARRLAPTAPWKPLLRSACVPTVVCLWRSSPKRRPAAGAAHLPAFVPLGRDFGGALFSPGEKSGGGGSWTRVPCQLASRDYMLSPGRFVGRRI